MYSLVEVATTPIRADSIVPPADRLSERFSERFWERFSEQLSEDALADALAHKKHSY